MKYYLFTFTNDGIPLALKLQQEGHDVIVGVVNDIMDLSVNGGSDIDPELPVAKQRRLSVYDGMIRKMDAWELIRLIRSQKSHKNSFVFFDRNTLFKFADALRDLDIAGNFPTKEDYLFELDRDEAKKFVSKNYPKLKVPDILEFNTINEAQKFLAKTDQQWVLKGRDERGKTFIPDIDDPRFAARQILEYLEVNKEKYRKNGFVLELKISPLIEITPEKIYYDGVPIVLNIDLDNKPFGSGNTSIQTGTAQELVFPVPFTERIHDFAFPPIVDEMAKKHKGLFFWDASLLIDKKTGRIYFGEFASNRPGYNTFFTELAQLPSVHHFFNSVMQKKNPFTFGTVGTSVRIFNPDTEDDQLGSLTPRNIVIDYMPHIEKDLWLWDVYKKDGYIVSAGYDWSAAVITGAGKSIDEAVNRMYRCVEDFSFPGSYWRPKFDFVSLDYPTSIPNRLNYGVDRGLFRLPFNVKIGELKATLY